MKLGTDFGSNRCYRKFFRLMCFGRYARRRHSWRPGEFPRVFRQILRRRLLLLQQDGEIGYHRSRFFLRRIQVQSPQGHHPGSPDRRFLPPVFLRYDFHRRCDERRRLRGAGRRGFDCGDLLDRPVSRMQPDQLRGLLPRIFLPLFQEQGARPRGTGPDRARQPQKHRTLPEGRRQDRFDDQRRRRASPSEESS